MNAKDDPGPPAQHEEALFAAASRLTSHARQRFLESACQGDAALRARLESRLAALEPASSSLAETVSDSGATRSGPNDAGGPAQSSSIAGAVIAGRYRLLEKLGEGGMGEVWIAQQSEPVSRQVALKLIKTGMDSKAVLQRFEQERQALALMDHPNIARVLDGGLTPTGQPFFVMELVRGQPLIKFCDDAKLTPKERLELFVPICQAVQHAHQKGIVHRDLKPANILVTVVDGKPVAKVIDFGVAKATGDKLTKETMATQLGGIIGTLEYMAPEQAGGEDIDTRADIYSLGVVLYELLTGVRPISSQRLKEAALVEVLRIVQQEEPAKPSTRLSTEAALPSLAAVRRIEPRKLMGLLRGELDWVVMRCLEKQRDRRYETANGLARDIQRYLAEEPVEARPPTAGYRFQKFVRRNKGQVIAASAVLLVLVLGIVGTSFGLLESKRQERLAEARRREAVAAEAEAKKRADELAKVSEFQAGMISQIDPTEAGLRLMAGLGQKLDAALEKSGLPTGERTTRNESFATDLARVNATDTAVEMIDRTILKPAIKAVDTQFRDQPVVDAKLRHTLAELYRNLGLYDEALPLAQQALATRRRVLGSTDPETLRSVNDLAVLLEALGKLPEAEQSYQEALAGFRQVKGEDDPDTLNALDNYGNFLRVRGRYAEAEPLLKSAVEKLRQVKGPEGRDTLIAVNCLGYLYISQGKLAQAEPLWRESYEKGLHAFGEEDPDVLVWLNNLAGLLQSQGKVKDAEPYFRQSVEKHQRIRGEEHPTTLQAMGALGGNLARQGRFSEAESLDREVLEKTRRLFGPDHPETLRCMNTVGTVYMQEGKLSEAEPYLRDCLAARRRIFGEDHPDTLTAETQLAQLLVNQTKYAEAESLYRDVLERSKRVLGAEHPDTLVRIINLGNLLLQEKRPDEAEPFIREAYVTRRRVSGENHPETLIALSNLGRLLEQQGKMAEAEQTYRDSLGRFRQLMGNEHPNTLFAIANLAALLRAEGKPAEAEPLYRECLAGFEHRFGTNYVHTGSAHWGLGRTLVGLKRFADAEPELLEGERVFSVAQGVPPSRRQQSLEALVELYTNWDKAEPNPGHAAKAQEWSGKLGALKK